MGVHASGPTIETQVPIETHAPKHDTAVVPSDAGAGGYGIHWCPATTILAARRQLSWPVGAGGSGIGRDFWKQRRCRPPLPDMGRREPLTTSA